VLAVTGTEIVLVDDDDDQIIRATVASMLEDFGCTVLMAQNGSEALAILESGTKVDLLFTDVVMSGTISGRQLAERAIEIVPTLKVLFHLGLPRERHRP
jgi:CheY-like chemotaxis protein